MIKKILVILDKSSSSKSANKLGIELAHTNKANLTGIGILDKPWIESPEAVPLGGAAYKVSLDAQMIQKTREYLHRLEKDFMNECNEQDASCSIIDTSGVPIDEIGNFATPHDLLIIGKDANFHFDPSEDSTVNVRELIKKHPRPTIVTSEKLPHQDSSNVLLAYDGTFASSRSIHMAILLGLLKGKTAHITTISSEKKEAENLVDQIEELCKSHAIKTHVHPIVSDNKPSLEILNLIKSLKPSLLVMGAYGHRGISYYFRGSCIEELVDSAKVPLFVYH